MLTTAEIVEKVDRAVYFLRQSGYQQPAADLVEVREQLLSMEAMFNEVKEGGCLK